MQRYRCSSALLVSLVLNSPSSGADIGAPVAAATSQPPPLPVGAAVGIEARAERRAGTHPEGAMGVLFSCSGCSARGTGGYGRA